MDTQNQMKVSGEPKSDTEGWKEIPEYSLELTRDRSIKYKTLLAGPYATTDQMRNDAAAFLHKLLDGSPIEQFVVLFLNLNNEVVGANRVAAGEMHKVHIDIKNIFRSAIVAGADRVVIAHNHPMGNSTASPQDIMLTANAIEVGQFLGIEIVDHIVVAPDGSHYSLWEHRERFEQTMVDILQSEGKNMDMISNLIQNIVSQLPPPEAGSLGSMRMDDTRSSAAKKSFPGGNPLGAIFAKLGIKPPGTPDGVPPGSDPKKN